MKGPRELNVKAPLEELPLFARAGTILPLLPPEVDTLAEDAAEGQVCVAR